MSSPRVGDRVTENGKSGQVVALRPQNMVDVVFDGRDYPMRRPADALTVVRSNPKPKTPVFIAAVLTPESKKALFKWWSTRPLAPDPLPILKSTHMTIKFRPSEDEVALSPIGQEVNLRVTGWAASGQIQAVAVEPEGVGSANEFPHITFALKDPSVAPRLSNDLFTDPKAKRQTLAGPTLTARVGWSDGSTYHFEPPVQPNPGPRGGLTSHERASLRTLDFALPGRRWPINDRRHAVIAMQYMLRGFGNESDYPTILAAIEKKYPRSDRRNAEIWDFHSKHFSTRTRLVANPREDVYDPAKEQLRAQAQGIYESLVRKELGLKYNHPFMDEKGVRLDSRLSEEKRRLLFHGDKKKGIRGAFGIAVSQQQRHGYIVPGTLEPTEKGRARAFGRLASRNVEHAEQNRQDYERTLAGVRKGQHFRIVAQEVEIGRGRTTTHYIVQPRPTGLVTIPEYRLTQRAAALDAERAEQAYRSASSGVRSRYNPRRQKTLEHVAVREEEAIHAVIDEFSNLPLDKAIDTLKKTADTIRIMERGMRQDALDTGQDPDLVKLSPRSISVLQAKLDSRDDLPADMRTVEQVLALSPQLPVFRPKRTLFIDLAVLEALTDGKVTLPFFQWKEYADARALDQLRAATEGAKVGGIAGSNKNRSDASAKKGPWDEALKNLNKTVLYAVPMPEGKKYDEIRDENGRPFKSVGDYGTYLVQKAASDPLLRQSLGLPEADPKAFKFYLDESLFEHLYKGQGGLDTLGLENLTDREIRGEIYEDEVPSSWQILEQSGDNFVQDPFFKIVKADTAPPVSEAYDLNKESDQYFRLSDVRQALAKYKPTDNLYLIEIDPTGLNRYLRWGMVKDVGLSPRLTVPLYTGVKDDDGKVVLNPVIRSVDLIDRNNSGFHDPGLRFPSGTARRRLLAVSPLLGKNLVVIKRPAAEVKSESQEIALDRQQEQREEKAFRAMAAIRQESGPFYDVERVMLLYRMEEGRDGEMRKRYFTYTLGPYEREEDVFLKVDFKPIPDDMGRIELPKVETRYVVYIPRRPRWISKKEYAGKFMILSTKAEAKGVGKSKAKGQSMEDAPLQEKRPKRKMALWTDIGVPSADSFAVYPSMILTKYFQVNPEGLGGEDKQAATEDASIQAQSDAAKAATQNREWSVLDTAGTVEGTQMSMSDMADFTDFLRNLRPQRAPSEKRVFLSPDENWVKYKRASNLFRRIRKGVYNKLTGEWEGSLKNFPQFDVFYTNSAPLAFLTIIYFNSPGLLPAIQTDLVTLNNVLKALPSRRVNVVQGNKEYEVDVDEMEMVEGPARVSQPRITREILDQADRTPGVNPLPQRVPLSVTPEFFEETTLGLMMLRRTFEEMAQSQFAGERRRAVALQQEELLKRRVKAAAKRAYAAPQPPPAAPGPRPAPQPSGPTLEEMAGAVIEEDLFNNNPRPRAAVTQRHMRHLRRY
jgi:hypothetical protein